VAMRNRDVRKREPLDEAASQGPAIDGRRRGLEEWNRAYKDRPPTRNHAPWRSSSNRPPPRSIGSDGHGSHFDPNPVDSMIRNVNVG